MGVLPMKLAETMSMDHNNASLAKNHRYPTRQKNIENRPKSTKKEYHDSFLVKGNRLYAKLPKEVTANTRLSHFTNALRKYMTKS